MSKDKEKFPMNKPLLADDPFRVQIDPMWLTKWLTNKETFRRHWRYTFAAMAMQGLLANSSKDYGWDGCAIEALSCADALLEKLEEKP